MAFIVQARVCYDILYLLDWSVGFPTQVQGMTVESEGRDQPH